MQLADTRILVVGGTSGIGAAVAAQTRAVGAAVTTASRRAAVPDGDPAATHLALDIANDAAVRAALAAQPPFDHVVVTSGGARSGRIRDCPTERFKDAFETKFWGAWRTAAFAPFAPEASLTLVSGVFAERPAAGQVAASCVNAAIEALARALAVELAPVRVNAVSPGLVDTPMWQGMPEDKRATYFASVAERLPARRICSSDDVAALILACMTNPTMTGAVLKIDGGYTLV